MQARARGLVPVVVPLIVDAPPADPAALDAALARLVAVDPVGRRGGRPAGGAGPDDPVGRDGAPSADGSRPEDRGHVAGAAPTEAARTAVPRPARGGPGASAPADDPAAPNAPVPAGPGYAWLVVTSATAVRVVAGRAPRLPSGVRIACVGEATARAARAAGWRVDLVPEDASAAGLVAAFPDHPGRVLHPRSAIAAPTLVEGLRARGIDVDDPVAYRTVGTGDEPVTPDPPPDVVLVTSGSVAREVVRRMTPLDPRTRIACIGPATAADARAAGLPVHVVARSRSAEALLDAVAAELLPTPDHTPQQEGHP